MNKVFFPPFFAKRKAKMNPELIKQLQATVDSEPVATDEYGEYRKGKFLHKNCLVTVLQENDVWSVAIQSYGNPISRVLIEEIRYKYIPNDAYMAMLFGERGSCSTQHFVQLYQIPVELVAEDGEQEPEAEAAKEEAGE